MGMTPGEKKAWNKGFEEGANSVEEGLPGWFGTFADMMTLLFAFFVLLAAISTMDPVKLQEMANSQGKSLGSKIKAQGKAEEEGEFEPIENLAEMKKEMQEAIEEMKKEKGAGWARNEGRVVGYAIATKNWSGYLPVRHEAGGNLNEVLVKNWLQKQISYGADIICHNASYDIGWMRRDGIELKDNRLIDTMVAAPLIDENRFSYALNSLGRDYLQYNKLLLFQKTVIEVLFPVLVFLYCHTNIQTIRYFQLG